MIDNVSLPHNRRFKKTSRVRQIALSLCDQEGSCQFNSTSCMSLDNSRVSFPATRAICLFCSCLRMTPSLFDSLLKDDDRFDHVAGVPAKAMTQMQTIESILIYPETSPSLQSLHSHIMQRLVDVFDVVLLAELFDGEFALFVEVDEEGNGLTRDNFSSVVPVGLGRSSHFPHLPRRPTTHQHGTPYLPHANRLVDLDRWRHSRPWRSTRRHVPTWPYRLPSHLPSFHVSRGFDGVVWAGAA